MQRVFVVLAAMALLAGCGVSKQLFAEKESELETCRSQLTECKSFLEICESGSIRLQEDLDSCEAARSRAAADLEACSTARAGAETNVSKANRELAACREEVSATRRQTDTLKAREADLRHRLQKEIDEKTVEIRRLEELLSVRVLDRVLFRLGSAVILPEGKATLDKVASVIADTQDMVRVEGHTDDIPIGEDLKSKYFSNWELSGARSASVVRYFQYARGIDPKRMEAVGLGPYRPVAPNDSSENRQKNRRVEIILKAAE